MNGARLLEVGGEFGCWKRKYKEYSFPVDSAGCESSLVAQTGEGMHCLAENWLGWYLKGGDGAES